MSVASTVTITDCTTVSRTGWVASEPSKTDRISASIPHSRLPGLAKSFRSPAKSGLSLRRQWLGGANPSSSPPGGLLGALESELSFVKEANEWDGTETPFDIARTGDKTEVRFTHHGLVPADECYDDCSNALGSYVNGSLRNLIATGKT
jgi:hypothetical protein